MKFVRRAVETFVRLLFGHDVFISYGRADGSDYALALGVRLTEEGISCYLDQWGSRPGRKVPAGVLLTARRCTLFVVVGTKAAGASEPVAEEIREFLTTTRPIIPVFFEAEPEGIKWLELIDGMARAYESPEALASARPSPKVIERIANAEGFTRRNVRLRRIAAATALVVALLVIGGSIVVSGMQSMLSTARTKLASIGTALATARQAVQEEEQRLHAQTALTEVKRRQAERFEHIAAAQLLVGHSIATRTVDPELGIALAMNAVRATRRFGEPVLPAAEGALHVALLTSKARRTFGPGTGHPMTGVAYDATRDRLATVGLDQPLRLWDLETGGKPITLPGPPGLTQVAFSNDGNWLATAGANVIVRDAETGKIRYQLPGQLVAFSDDNTRIAVADAGGIHGAQIHVYDVNDGHNLLSFPTESAVVAIAFSPNGKHLVSAYSQTQMLAIWTLETRYAEPLIATDGMVPASVAYSPDGHDVVAAGPGGAGMWHTRTGKLETGLERRDVNDGRGTTSGRTVVAFSHDGKRLAIGDDSGEIRIAGLESTDGPARVLRGHRDAVMSVAFSPDGRHLASASRDGTVRLWDVDVTSELRVIDAAAAVAFAADSKRVLLSDGEVFDVRGGEGSKLFEGKSVVGVSQDWSRAAVSTPSGPTEVWSVRPRRRLFAVRAPVAFSGDGSRIVTSDGVVWNGAARTHLQGQRKEPFVAVAISADGRYAAGSAHGVVKLFDGATGAVLFQTRAPGAAVRALAFSPDGTLLASASDDGKIGRWDVATRRPLPMLDDHGGAIMDLCFSPDGERIATAENDGRIKLRNAKTGEEIITLGGDTRPVERLTFSPDGTLLATGEDYNGTRLWVVDLTMLLKLAKRRITRPMTNDECRKYLGESPCPPLL